MCDISLSISRKSEAMIVLSAAYIAIQREYFFHLHGWGNKQARDCLKPTGNICRCLVSTSGKRSCNHWLKKIIGPLEIQQDENEMNRHKDHRPVKPSTGLDSLLVCQSTENIHDARIYVHSNDNPGRIEALRNNLLRKRRYLISAFVYDATHNQEPGIYFNR